MRNKCHRSLVDSVSADREVDLEEIVMGLRWHPQEPGASAGREPANLDASWRRFRIRFPRLHSSWPAPTAVSSAKFPPRPVT